MKKHLLHWSPRSPFVKKIDIALAELGLFDEVNRIRSVVPTDDFEHPIFLDNPLGRIPTLVTPEGISLQDSTVVMEYLDCWVSTSMPKQSLRLFPQDSMDRVKVRQIEMLCNGAMEVLVSWIIEWYLPTARGAASYRIYRYKVENTLDVLNTKIETLNENEINAASISVMAFLAYLDFRFSRIVEWRHGRNELADWFSQYSLRPSLKNNPFKEG